MNRRQGRKLISLYAIEVFLDAHRDQLPKTSSTGMRERFDRALAELQLHVQTQAAAPLQAEGLTNAKDAKREALLRDHMAPIARIARLEAAAYPALAPLKMPRGEPAVQKLLAHAAGMASVAQDYMDVFIAAGMRPTFIDDLNTAIDDILSTLTARGQRRAAHSGATRGLDETLKACFKYRAVLDSFIRTEARDDLPLLANWRSVKRVDRLPARRKQPATGTQTAEPRQIPAATLPIRDASRLLAAPIPDALRATSSVAVADG